MGLRNFIYWFSFVLMWFVIPLQQGYVVAGEFTVKTKLIASLRSNLKFYLITGPCKHAHTLVPLQFE